MLKLKIFVHCKGWEAGGYHNTLYFESDQQADEWLQQNPDCDEVSRKWGTIEQFVEDYIRML